VYTSVVLALNIKLPLCLKQKAGVPEETCPSEVAVFVPVPAAPYVLYVFPVIRQHFPPIPSSVVLQLAATLPVANDIQGSFVSPFTLKAKQTIMKKIIRILNTKIKNKKKKKRESKKKKLNIISKIGKKRKKECTKTK